MLSAGTRCPYGGRPGAGRVPFRLAAPGRLPAGRIAVNKAKDYLKSAHCRHTQVTADETLRLFSDTAPGPEQLAEDRDAARRALESIRTMDGPYRDVCTAYFVQERPAAQIALQLNRPARTVHTQIYRARARLRSQLATA